MKLYITEMTNGSKVEVEKVFENEEDLLGYVEEKYGEEVREEVECDGEGSVVEDDENWVDLFVE